MRPISGIMNLGNRLATLTIAGVLVVGTVSLSTVAFADPDSAKNGWGEATSERATEQGDVGEHASDPNGDGTPGNDNQHTDDNDNNHRSGIGNVAKSLEDLGLIEDSHPSDLGEFLDCADEFPEEDGSC